MATPVIANSASGTTGGSNLGAVAADISGWTLAENDLLVVFVGLDADRSGSVSLTQSGFTELFDAVGGSGVTGAAYYKQLVSGDTSWTEIEATWTGSEKAAIHVFRFAAGDHNGIDDSAGTSNTLDSTPTFGAVTYSSNAKSLAFIAINGNPTVSVNPTGYATEITAAPTGGGAIQTWSGSDELTGAQSAVDATITSGQDSYTIVIGVAEAAGGGSALVSIVDETVSLPEVTQRNMGLVRLMEETLLIAETERALMGMIRRVNETISVSEGTRWIRGLYRIVNEVVTLSEEIIRTLTSVGVQALVAVIDEVVILTTVAIRVTGFVRVINETISITTSIASSLGESVRGMISWATFKIEPKISGILKYFGPKITGKIKDEDGGISDI